MGLTSEKIAFQRSRLRREPPSEVFRERGGVLGFDVYVIAVRGAKSRED
jgi:hypothetical protein